MEHGFGSLLFARGRHCDLEDVHGHRQERPLLFVSAFDNGLADRSSAVKRLNGTNPIKYFTNLVNFRPIISEFTLLKHVIMAVIEAKFDG